MVLLTGQFYQMFKANETPILHEVSLQIKEKRIIFLKELLMIPKGGKKNTQEKKGKRNAITIPQP